ncbi:hypothetical protein LCGC14_2736830, partial [marine sediment metagenome]
SLMKRVIVAPCLGFGKQLPIPLYNPLLFHHYRSQPAAIHLLPYWLVCCILATYELRRP